MHSGHQAFVSTARLLCAAALLVLGSSSAGSAEDAGARAAVERGQYIFRASGGCSCHTDAAGQGAFMAGGRPLKTPFGTVYGTNITPHARTGIGAWSATTPSLLMRRMNVVSISISCSGT